MNQTTVIYVFAQLLSTHKVSAYLPYQINHINYLVSLTTQLLIGVNSHFLSIITVLQCLLYQLILLINLILRIIIATFSPLLRLATCHLDLSGPIWIIDLHLFKLHITSDIEELWVSSFFIIWWQWVRGVDIIQFDAIWLFILEFLL